MTRPTTTTMDYNVLTCTLVQNGCHTYSKPMRKTNLGQGSQASNAYVIALQTLVRPVGGRGLMGILVC